MTFVFMTCALVTCVLCAGSRAEELRFRFQPGDKYFLLYSISQKVEQVIDGQPQTTDRTIRLGCDLEITEVEDSGAAWAKYTYKQVAMKSNDSTGYNEFDSEADVNRPKIPIKVLPWYVALDEGLYIKITPQGRITRINGLQAIIESARSKVLVSAARRSMAAAFEAIDGWFTETEVKTILENQLAVFPPSGVLRTDPCAHSETNDITVGEPNRWERIERVEGSDMIMQYTFRLAEVKPDGNAVIDINLTIKTADDAKEIVLSGIKTRHEISGQGQGQIEIDESTGQIINKRLAYDWADEIKAVSRGQVRRIPPVPKPVRTHVETTFQMIKRESVKPSAQVALPEPNKP